MISRCVGCSSQLPLDVNRERVWKQRNVVVAKTMTGSRERSGFTVIYVKEFVNAVKVNLEDILFVPFLLPPSLEPLPVLQEITFQSSRTSTHPFMIEEAAIPKQPAELEEKGGLERNLRNRDIGYVSGPWCC